MARKVILTKISSVTPQETREYNGVGKDSYSGVMILGPEVGKSFTFHRDDGHSMWTSAVKNIQYVNDKLIKLTTNNSEYELEIGEEIK